MTRRRQPSAEELALWRRAIAGARPLGRAAASAQPPDEAEREQKDAATPAPASPVRPARPVAVPRPYARALDPQRPVDLDRRTWLRLKRGQVSVEQSLDLHGQTQAQAHARLRGFLANAQAQNCRCVLVVTGKGVETGGTLRHMVPRWLNEEPNRARVVAYCPAQPRHGGAGALYVLLRRRRPAG